jgi:hypothetical protein
MAGFNGTKERAGGEIVDIRLARADKDATEAAREATDETRAFSPFLETTHALVYEVISREAWYPDFESDVIEKLFKVTKGDARLVTEATILHVYKQMRNGMM